MVVVYRIRLPDSQTGAWGQDEVDPSLSVFSKIWAAEDTEIESFAGDGNSDKRFFMNQLGGEMQS